MKNEIILYTTGCPKCQVLKRKLDDRKIIYILNSSVDEMLKLGITQVPVLSIDGQLKNFRESVEWIANQGGI